MNRTNRRTFLQTALGATAVAALAPRALPQTTGKNDSSLPLPCAPTAWKKHGIILEATEPWEGRGIQNFTSPAELLPNGEWRLWYSISGSRSGVGIAYADGVPGKPMKKFPAQSSTGDPEDAPFAIGNLPDKEPVHRSGHGNRNRMSWVPDERMKDYR